MNDIAVVGAGAWGTALSIQAVRAGCSVVLWARHPARLAGRENPRLPGHRLNTLQGLVARHVAGKIGTDAEIVVCLRERRRLARERPHGTFAERSCSTRCRTAEQAADALPVASAMLAEGSIVIAASIEPLRKPTM